MASVLNIYHKNDPVGTMAETVYIGRPTKWGNPFIIGRDGSRAEVIEKYREYLFTTPNLIDDAKIELKGKDLSCFCAPRACHGDILLEVANG